MPYQPALDGIRAVAVAAILLYHGGVSVVSGGFLAVDIFFVLSGFLITSLLLAEWAQSGTLNLKEFWVRRARRLLPALLLLLAVILLVSLFVAGRQGETMRTHSVATLFYASNWWFIAEGSNYFDQFSDPSPLRHTWTLAIEEQWYLLLPLFLLGVLSWLKHKRWLAVIFLVLALGSATLMGIVANDGAGQTRGYYGTDTRVQALLVGAGLAVVLTPGVLARLIPYSRWLAIGGLTVAAAMLVFISEQSTWLYRGGFLVFAIAVAAILIDVSARPTGLLARGLSITPVVWLGKVSYGVYLWHWPVYLFLTPERVGVTGIPLLVVRVGVTIGIATASYYLVELPIRQGALGRMRPERRRALYVAVPVALVSVLLVGFVFTRPAAPDSLETLAVRATERPLVGPQSDVPTQSPQPARSASQPQRQPVGPTRAVLVGDSNALSLYAAYKPNLVPGLAVAPGTEFGCGVAPYNAMINGQQLSVPDKCWQWVRTNRLTQIRSASANLGVLFAGSWEQYDRQISGEQVSIDDPRWQQQTTAAYRELIELLHREIGSVAVVLNVCNGAKPQDLPIAAQYESGRYPEVVNDVRRTRAVNTAIIAAAESVPYKVPVIDLYSHVCPHGFEATTDGVEMRTDGLHYSTDGGQLVWSWLGPRLIQARQATSQQ